MKKYLDKQLALDYCVEEAYVRNPAHQFNTFTAQSGQRRFVRDETCELKIATYNKKLLVTGTDAILSDIEANYKEALAPWFMEPHHLMHLSDLIWEHNQQIRQMHIFYIPRSLEPQVLPPFPYEIRVFSQEDLIQFKGDDRFDEALLFNGITPDMIGVAAIDDGRIIGMAGASADGAYLWQIGVNTIAPYRSCGVGTYLVKVISNLVLEEGKVPYYGTSVSHLVSQRVAQSAGFVPMWTELMTEPIPTEPIEDEEL